MLGMYVGRCCFTKQHFLELQTRGFHRIELCVNVYRSIIRGPQVFILDTGQVYIEKNIKHFTIFFFKGVAQLELLGFSFFFRGIFTEYGIRNTGIRGGHIYGIRNTGISSETTIPGISSETTIPGISSETTETRESRVRRRRAFSASSTLIPSFPQLRG